MLFYADGVQSGGGDNSSVLRVYHTGLIAGESAGSNDDSNQSPRRRRRQQQQQPQILAIDFAQVTQLSPTNTTNSAGGPVTASSPFPWQTSVSPSPDASKNGKVMLSTGTIVGIALSVLAVLVLLIVLLVVCHSRPFF
jgi:hypothetical protein